MNKTRRLEWLLAGLLHYGTWVASATIGVGVVLALMNLGRGIRVATIGIALLILLPSLRVLLMLVVFVRHREYRFSFIAALVLAIILLGFAIGMRSASATAG